MLHVDLGTAPVEALTELLAIARTTGASAIALVDPVVRPTTPSGEALN